jgi:3-oxoadipate enol-lactonase
MASVEGRAGTGDASLHYRIDGPEHAPPVLLINSLGSALDLWTAQAPAWSTRFRVVRYDTRGHGQSGVPPGEYSLADLGADAVRVLDAAGVGQAHICGISIGGLTTMWLGVHRPDRIRSLVVANTAAKVGPPERWIERAAKVRADGLDAIADLNMTTWFTSAFRDASPATVARFHRMVSSSSPDGYIGCCAVLRDADVRDEIQRIAAPTLVVGGSHDVTTPVAESDFIRSQIPGALQLNLPSAHLSNVECADAFTRMVGAFLS